MDTDIIKVTVPMFIRLLELAKEEVKQDIDLHKIAEVATLLSKQRVITTADYEQILRSFIPPK